MDYVGRKLFLKFEDGDWTNYYYPNYFFAYLILKLIIQKNSIVIVITYERSSKIIYDKSKTRWRVDLRIYTP